MNWQNVIAFWFDELTPAQHFSKSDELDRVITTRFDDTLSAAKLGELYMWRTEPLGRLAEIIVLDQFARNIYRDDKRAFESDPLALVLAQEAIAHRLDVAMSIPQKSFLYMPFMHSESPSIHKVAVTIFDQPGLENTLNFEHKHKEIIDRFGRYPHRNSILGRRSTDQENAFLNGPNSSF
ncbi:DUF924 family protein [Psychrosphaera algicola]|uniref:DUF924 domain-containing protein n=1 Tax=Psychrosphaera algicola TaxID=3023714 RepID=A0ABT5F8P8_9GAMM|nr:DUF924 family protein [Psychrosphaera sp. G1-22]MDC2887911.1 DUF924 domain-containing protein [Psychrosphaera sp. G1-22]